MPTIQDKTFADDDSGQNGLPVFTMDRGAQSSSLRVARATNFVCSFIPTKVRDRRTLGDQPIDMTNLPVEHALRIIRRKKDEVLNRQVALDCALVR